MSSLRAAVSQEVDSGHVEDEGSELKARVVIDSGSEEGSDDGSDDTITLNTITRTQTSSLEFAEARGRPSVLWSLYHSSRQKRG